MLSSKLSAFLFTSSVFLLCIGFLLFMLYFNIPPRPSDTPPNLGGELPILNYKHKTSFFF